MFWQQKEALTLIIGVTVLLGLLTAFLALTIIVYNKRKRKHFLEKELIEKNFQQTLLQTQLEIQEQTLKTISQEIHDNIGQALTLAKLNLNTMPPTGTDVQEKIITTKELVSKAIVDLRDLSRSLNTDYVADMGLQRAIEYELSLISKSSAIETRMHTEGDPIRMDKQKELILFRMVQELLNNALKHAGAQSIEAIMKFSNTGLVLTITDDGKGFEPDATAPTTDSGLGLRNMHNRAKLIGADFSISSSPGNGSSAQISLHTTT
jgi:two-component system, NarL family, sensor kinase